MESHSVQNDLLTRTSLVQLSVKLKELGEEAFRQAYQCSFLVAYTVRPDMDPNVVEQATVEWCSPGGFDQLTPGTQVIALRQSDAAPLGSKITLGRSSKNDVVIKAPKVSKTHAVFHVDELGNYQLQDLGSLNGTKVNAQKLTGDMRVPLKNGDVIAFFDAIFIYTILDNMILKLTYL